MLQAKLSSEDKPSINIYSTPASGVPLTHEEIVLASFTLASTRHLNV